VELHYFDFVPPPGWNGFRLGRQMRLIPPNTPPQSAPCAIIVSPLVPRSVALPPADILIEQTLAAEMAVVQSRVASQEGPTPARSEFGLAGVSYDVHVQGPTGMEHRLYVLLVDNLCYYGLSYLASEDTFGTHVQAFWNAVATIKPFAGRIVTPAASPFDHYND
jgi:hypothetical protein